MSFYSSAKWRCLARGVKRRDAHQCQVCGDSAGDPYCVLHAHHLLPRAKGGPDTLDNLITLCDLCHAVVTRRWHKPWFGSAAVQCRQTLEEASAEYQNYLALPLATRAARRAQLWAALDIRRVD